MKRFLISLVAALGLAVLLAPNANANVNSFVITDYKIDYTLGRDSDNRSTLQATETITVKFPQTNQNHGIERSMPKKYDGHPTSLKVESITKPNGDSWQYEKRSQNGNTILRIGDPDEYVHGTQVYKIHYSQRDVTKYFSDTSKDEFYWNTVGTDWQVPINHLSVTLNIDDQLSSSLTGDSACYFGVRGSSQACQLSKAGNSFEASEWFLKPGENITLAVGFTPHTFAKYEMSTWQRLQRIWIIVQLALIAVVIGLLIWLSVRYARQSNRTNEQKPIAPEYLVPKDASVIVSAKLLNAYNTFAALLLDLAIRRYIQIREVKAKGLFTNAEYEIEIIKPIDDLRPEEAEVIHDIFSDQVAPGAKLNLKTLQSNFAIQRRIQDNPIKLVKLIRNDYNLRAKDDQQSVWYKRFGVITLVFAIVLLSPGLLLVAAVAAIMSITLWPLTDKGLALMRYLKGLKMYVKLAEADRINMLQSPEGVEKVGDINDEANLIKLYEKLLPYAVLFGVEKDWNEQLGRHYENLKQQPDWYTGTSAVYSAAAFSGAMNSFKSSSISSGGGGSSGGGSSGGGGGGGGGGGW